MNTARIPYLYITGASFSGSTLLTFLLNSHPQMVSISQTGGPIPSAIIERYRCSCGVPLLNCPFFLELEWRINALGSSFSLKDWQTRFRLSKYRLLNIFLVRPLRNIVLERVRDRLVPFWPGYHQAITTISQRIFHLAQAALSISGKQIFVDADKDPIRIKFLKGVEQFDLRVVHLVRDVRGAAASYLKNTMRSGRAVSVSHVTRVWYIENSNSERARRFVPPDRWLQIRYDELCTDPQGTVDRIAEFVGAEHAYIPKDFYETEHHILGNRMRLNGKRSGIIKLDESWRDRLSKGDLATITRIAGAANRYYGHNWP